MERRADSSGLSVFGKMKTNFSFDRMRDPADTRREGSRKASAASPASLASFREEPEGEEPTGKSGFIPLLVVSS